MSLLFHILADIGTSNKQWDDGKNPTDDPDVCRGNVVRDNTIKTHVGFSTHHTQVERHEIQKLSNISFLECLFCCLVVNLLGVAAAELLYHPSSWLATIACCTRDL